MLAQDHVVKRLSQFFSFFNVLRIVFAFYAQLYIDDVFVFLFQRSDAFNIVRELFPIHVRLLVGKIAVRGVIGKTEDLISCLDCRKHIFLIAS